MDKQRVSAALEHWVRKRQEQLKKSHDGGRAQQGNRAAVTGGAHLDGLNDLIAAEIARTGASGLELRTGRRAVLPGFYRPSKAWDLVVMQDKSPVLAIEYKSMSGSEGKNLNNRADEIFGMAEDLRQAELHGQLPNNLRRAYIFVMALTPASTAQVRVPKNLRGADSIFDERSYFERAVIMCRRMRESGLFHMTWAVGVQESPFRWCEPDEAVGWQRFASDLRHSFRAGRATRPHVP